MLCQDLISQVGVQGVGPLSCLIAGLFCDPGQVTAPAWALVFSVTTGDNSCLVVSEDIGRRKWG